jgi:uncharacterized protein (TIGR02611 family)
MAANDPHHDRHEHAHHDGRFAFDDRLGERLDRLEEAAIEAELATGRAEETVEEAKRHVLVRLAIIVGGSVVTLIGLVLLVAPGPGWLVILAGLLLLSKEVPFAARWVDRVRARLPQDENGKLPASAIASIAAVTLFFVVGSLWFAFGRG